MLVVTDLDKLKDYGFVDMFDDNTFYVKEVIEIGNLYVQYLVNTKTKKLTISTDDEFLHNISDNTINDMIKDKVLIKKE